MKRILTSAAVLWGLSQMPAMAILEDNFAHIPPEVDGVIHFQIDENTWRFLTQKKGIKNMVVPFVSQLSTALEEGYGLTWEKDLKPVLGNHMTLGLLSQPSPNRVPYLPLFATIELQNASAYKTMMQKIQKVALKDPQKQVFVSTYQGHTLYGLGRPQKSKNIPIISRSGNTLVVGNLAQVKAALDSRHQKIALLNKDDFTSVLGKMRDKKAWVYFNPKHIENVFHYLPVKPPTPERLALLKESLDIFQSMSLGINIAPEGLTFHSLAKIHPQKLNSPAYQKLKQSFMYHQNPMYSLSPVVETAAIRPLFFTAAQQLDLATQGVNLFFPGNDRTREIYKHLVDFFERFTHLSFSQDIVPHTDGRYGIQFFYPESNTSYKQLPMAVIFLGINPNYHKAFQQRLLDKMVVDFKAFEAPNVKGEYSNSSETLEFPKTPSVKYQGIDIYVAKDGATQKTLERELGIRPAYARLGSIWIFGSNLKALQQVIHHQLKNNLHDNPRFHALFTKLQLNPDMGVTFVDLSKAVDVLSFYLGADQEVQRLLPTMKAMKSVIAGGRLEKDMIEGVIHVDAKLSEINYDHLLKWLL